MAWLITHNDGNKIIDRHYDGTAEQTFYDTSGQAHTFTRTVSYTEYRYVAMAYSAAVICKAAVLLASTATSCVAEVNRENAAGAYGVNVVEKTFGAWGS